MYKRSIIDLNKVTVKDTHRSTASSTRAAWTIIGWAVSLLFKACYYNIHTILVPKEGSTRSNEAQKRTPRNQSSLFTYPTSIEWLGSVHMVWREGSTIHTFDNEEDNNEDQRLVHDDWRQREGMKRECRWRGENMTVGNRKRENSEKFQTSQRFPKENRNLIL